MRMIFTVLSAFLLCVIWAGFGYLVWWCFWCGLDFGIISSVLTFLCIIAALWPHPSPFAARAFVGIAGAIIGLVVVYWFMRDRKTADVPDLTGVILSTFIVIGLHLGAILLGRCLPLGGRRQTRSGERSHGGCI